MQNLNLDSNFTLFQMVQLLSCKLSPICWKCRLNASTILVISFRVHNIRLTAKTIAPFQRTYNSCQEYNIHFLHSIFIRMRLLLLKSVGIHWSRYMCMPHMQTNPNIFRNVIWLLYEQIYAYRVKPGALGFRNQVTINPKYSTSLFHGWTVLMLMVAKLTMTMSEVWHVWPLILT
jgi:hypothetical protein